MKRIVVLVAVAVAIMAIGVGAFMHFREWSPDRSRYPVRGVDVSRHQKEIDWTKLARDDVSFAIMKATEGGDWVDPLFARNFAEARAQGLAVGAYHFYRLNKTGAEQARNFLRTVPREPGLLPPVIDIEFSGNGPERPSPEELRNEVQDFLDLVEPAYGKPAVIYIIGEAEAMYGAALPARRRWVRSLVSHPGHENWLYWQYHNMGRVAGVEGDVDLNVLQGDAEALAELRRP